MRGLRSILDRAAVSRCRFLWVAMASELADVELAPVVDSYAMTAEEEAEAKLFWEGVVGTTKDVMWFSVV